MTSKKALKIISIGGLLQCLSVIITPEFYIYELFHKLPHHDILLPELKTYIFICVACGINLSILIFLASTLEEYNAKTMLKGVSLSFGIMTVTLFAYFFSTPIRPPYFILYLVLIFCILAFVVANKKNTESPNK